MKSFHNIHKPAFRGHAYTGYAHGLVFHIIRVDRGWVAVGNGQRIERPTLALMSVALDNVLPIEN